MPKVVNSEEITKSILGMSLKLFAQKGYNGLSMRGLAQELKMTTGTLYHYFKNKDELYQKIFTEFTLDDSQELLTIIENTKTFEERLDLFLEFLIKKETYFKEILLITLDANKLTPANVNMTGFFKMAVHIYESALMKTFKLKDPAQANFIFDYLLGQFCRSILLPNTKIDFKILRAYLVQMEPKNASH